MQALLDTHTLLWWLSDDPALSKSACKLIADTGNLILVSAASAWEIATKVRLGKLPAGADLVADFAGHLQQEAFEMLAISWDHAIRAGSLPGPHKDPFDRMLIAQAQAENIPILSNEALFDVASPLVNPSPLMAGARFAAFQQRQTRRQVFRHRKNGAQAGQVEHVPDSRVSAHQDEPAAGFGPSRGVKAYDESDPRGADRVHLAEVRQNLRARQPFDLVAFGGEVLKLAPRRQAPSEAGDANVSSLLQIYF
jgi:PIN domain nuclease of toxin-antitoxin system